MGINISKIKGEGDIQEEGIPGEVPGPSFEEAEDLEVPEWVEAAYTDEYLEPEDPDYDYSEEIDFYTQFYEGAKHE